MDKLYRFFTWVILAALTLVVLPFFLLLPCPAWSSTPLTLLICLVLLFCGWRSILKKDVVAEPRRVSRVQSALIWIAVLLDFYAVFHWVGFQYGGIAHCSRWVRSSPMFLAALVATLLTVFRPFSKHAHGTGLGVAGILSGLLISTACILIVTDNFDWKGKQLPAEYPMPVEAQRLFFPENASDFEIEGASGFLNFYVEWNCKVSEKDFESFRKQHGYRFVLNRTDVNEDAAVGPLWYDDENWPKPYLFHNNRHANGGGLTLRYSVPEQKLYGYFSNR